MKPKRRRGLALGLAVALALTLLSGTALAAAPTMQGAELQASPGETVTYTVQLKDNPGIAGVMLYLRADTKVFQVPTDQDGDYEVSTGEATAGGSMLANTLGNEGWQVLWFQATNSQKDGVFLKIKLKVSQDAKTGTYPIQLALSPENTVDQNGKQVSLACVNGSIQVKGNAQTPGSGGNNGSSGTTKPSQPTTPTTPDTPNQSDAVFSDVPATHWAYASVMELQKRGIVNGVQKGIFAPNAEVTRAQFMKMLAGVAGAQVGEPDKALPFTDVAEGSWYTPYVAWAYQTGVVNGVSATSFAPDAPISRQQICAMLQRLAEKQGITLPEKTAEITFKDQESIQDYAKAAVTAMQKAGLLSGYEDGTFRPANHATRAESAKILAAFLEIKEGMK